MLLNSQRMVSGVVEEEGKETRRRRAWLKCLLGRVWTWSESLANLAWAACIERATEHSLLIPDISLEYNVFVPLCGRGHIEGARILRSQLLTAERLSTRRGVESASEGY